MAHLALNRPARSNAIDLATARAFARAIAEIERSPDVKVILLRAEGANFCVGGDVGDMAAAPDTGAFIAELADEMHRALTGLAALAIPVVAAVQGAVAGAGLGLVLAADLVLCTETARFRTAYSGVGLSPDCGVSYWLPRTVGTGRALQMLLSNTMIDANTAWEWGMVSSIVPTAKLEDQAVLMATALADASAPALGQARRLVRAASARTLGEHLDDEAAAIARLAAGADARERIGTFVREKHAAR
ncbi:enoyl-CoA hydratase/isomerase family protein [Nocardia nova]|uniref:enoyl-CoA hydratase/isomerase family protein n=1 Tax=Nocardia nova TaxID=37330 RepID=UPI001FE60AFB|nr:enoyl-CoA hydratase-related protein [Nocardia nova]